MCWAEKFCFCVPLNLGCVLLGATNFVIALCMALLSILYFTNDRGTMLDSPKDYSAIIQLELSQVSLDIVFAFTLTVALFWMLFSLLLVLGIARNISSYILAFFFFGILLVIFGNLGALLVVLRSCRGCLELGLIMFVFSLLYIHFLVAVYTVYELMQKGKDFRFHNYNTDNDSLLTADDFN